MNPTPALCFVLLMASGPLPVRSAGAVQIAKPIVTKPSELPPHAYTIPGRPSEVVQNPGAVLALGLQMEKDLKADLEGYEIRDRGLLQGIHTELYWISVLKQDPGEARRHLDRVRDLMEDPIRRLMVGLTTEPYLQAKEGPGSDFHGTFRSLLTQRLEALPYADVQFGLNGLRAWLNSISKSQLVGSVETGLDSAARDGKLTREMANGILSVAVNLEINLALKDDLVACLEKVIEAHKADPEPKFAPVLGTPSSPIKGAWFGQPWPGERPVRFAPEILDAINLWAEGIAFSPDGKECFLGVGSPNYGRARTYRSTWAEGGWTPFVEPAFLSEFVYTNELDYSPDGKTLTFTGKMAGGSMDFWTVPSTERGWGLASVLPALINSVDDEWRGSTTADGVRYFGRNHAGMNQVHKATRDASGRMRVEKLGPPINTQSFDADPCVAPDGRWLVFFSAREGGIGGADLWVSFPDRKGEWGMPINLGPDFNSAADEYGAHLTPDGRYLFFTRHTQKGNETHWVAASAIDKARPGVHQNLKRP